MTSFSTILAIFYVFGIIWETQAQLGLNGCPKGWVDFDAHCYHFVYDDKRIEEEADSICWTQGARLVTVNSFTEHAFVADWLNTNDKVFRNTWFTGGFYANGRLHWETGDVIYSDDVTPFWNTLPSTQISRLYNRLAYKPGNSQSGYGWELVSPSQPSSYICEIAVQDVDLMDFVERDYDYGLSHVDKETLPHGPHMTSEPQNVVVLGEGYDFYLECVANAVPIARYEWKRGNDTLAASTRYTLSAGRITLSEPTSEVDGGSYQCKATNDIGSILSSVAQVTFGYLHAFSPVRPENQAGTMFEGVRISCYTPAYNPSVRYGWFKNHNTHNYVFPGHPVHFVSQSGYLYFSEVQPTDDRTYYCVVTLVAPYNSLTDTTLAPSRVGLGTKLVLRPGKTDNNYGPIIHTHSFPTPAMKGSLVRLECIAYGSLPLTYAWKRENGVPFVKGTKLSDRNRVLTISNAPLEAEGNYICTVTRRGTTKSSATISLNMETKPYFVRPIMNMFVDPAQTVRWRCRSVARPPATYSWYKDGQLLQSTPGKTEIRGNSLTLRNVIEADHGMYQCAATNAHGTSLSSGELKVLSFAPNFNRYPMRASMMAPVDGSATIECKVEGAPTPDVQWLKDGAPLNLVIGDVSGRLKMTLTYDLILTAITFSDQGLYVCKATNVNGEAQNSTFVTIVEGVVIDHPPQPSEVIVNRTQFMFCSATQGGNFIDVMYEWRFNGHPIRFQNNQHLIKGVKNGLEGLYIREAQYSHAGKYTCVARTPLHADESSANLFVRGPPGAPAGVYIDDASVTSYQARVIWTAVPGLNHGGPITSYDIEVNSLYYPDDWVRMENDIQEAAAVQLSTDSGEREDQRSAIVQNLVPNTNYRFRVRAINEHGRGNKASSPSVYIKTPSTAPYRAPANVGGGDGKVGTLNISWTPLPEAEHCGQGIGYKVYWKRNLESNRNVWDTEKLEGNVGTYTVLVGKDNYYLEYLVKVQAYNDIGDGPNSTDTAIFSAMGIPTVVPMITGVSGINISTVDVTWDMIPDDRDNIKGKVLGYTIQYYWNDQGCNPMTNCEITNLRTLNVWGQTDHVTLIDLEMNSEFFFRLQVFNSAGRGPKGEWRRGETATYAPLNYPRSVKVTSNGPNSVQVTWLGVMTTVNEEIITGYKVKWWKVQDDIRNANETLSDQLDTQVTVYGLQQKTVYQIRVQGISAGGDGSMSNSVYFTLQGGQLTIDPSTTAICYEERTCSASNPILDSMAFMVSMSIFLLLR